MPVFVRIAVNIPSISGVFDYHLPAGLQGVVAPGHLVEVPFGQQKVQGVVLEFVREPAVPETRPVTGLIDPLPVLTGAQIKLAEEMAQRSLAPLATCIGLMIPPGLNKQADVLYSLPERGSGSAGGAVYAASARLSPLQSRILELVQKRGSLRGNQVEKALPRQHWRAAIQGLVHRGLLASHSILPPPSTRAKSVRTVRLSCPIEQAEQAMPTLGRAGSESLQRRQAIIQFLIKENTSVETSWVYAESGGSAADLKYLQERGLVTFGEEETYRDPLSDIEFVPVEPPPLIHAQQVVWVEIQAGLRASLAGQQVPPYLLHGVTGSGKTELYLQAAAETLSSGRKVIFLVPEIAMTPQTVRRVLARFPGQVGVIHSGLSEGERFDTWRRLRAGGLGVVVGPRSALFAPLDPVGLIVVDECHDDSYFQADPLPHYHAREEAVAYASLARAVCILGSATPDIDSRYKAQQGVYRYLSLPVRVLAHRQSVQSQMEKLALSSSSSLVGPVRVHPLEGQAETIDLPAVQVVDMRQELKAGNRSIFSRALQADLATVLGAGQQAILFLNRRGTATYVFCRECGYTLKCPRCDTPLTFHTSFQEFFGGDLVCHRCNYRRKMPDLCPNCKSRAIRQFGTGTEKVEAEVRSFFPAAKTLRWDYETTRQKGAHEQLLSRFTNHQADVLIGTQMIAKGLDLPLVTLVGVVLADSGLNLPDYRMAERTFQLLTQVAGRAGRSPLGGKVILQTFQPDHYVIRAASQHNYEAFYRQELAYRRKLEYPPFARFARLEFRHAQADKAEAAAQDMAEALRTALAAEERRATELIGPAPCFFARVDNLYRWQIILRGPDPAAFLRGRAFPNGALK